MSVKRRVAITAGILVGASTVLIAPLGRSVDEAFAAKKQDVTLVSVGGTSAPELAVKCVGIYDRVSTAAEIRNNSDKVATHVKVVWQLFDASGKPVKTGGFGSAFGISESVTIPPHQTAFAVPNDIEVPAGSPPPARFRAHVEPGYVLKKHEKQSFETGTVDVAKLKFAFSGLVYQSNPGRQVLGTTFCPGGRLEGTITNGSGVDLPATTTPGLDNRVHVKCALYDGKKIVGGFFTFLDAMANGASAPFSGGNGLVAGLSPTDIRCAAELSGG